MPNTGSCVRPSSSILTSVSALHNPGKSFALTLEILVPSTSCRSIPDLAYFVSLNQRNPPVPKGGKRPGAGRRLGSKNKHKKSDLDWISKEVLKNIDSVALWKR